MSDSNNWHGNRIPILMTVSFNCADYEESSYYQSRARWAEANGFRHLYVSERTTGLRMDGHCAAWLRLPLMSALAGQPIFYLDNDCVIAADCPHPALVTGGLDEVFIARGHSGRPNSGVLLVSAAGSELFDFCVDHIDRQPPAECQAPYENGHVIWGCTQLPWRPLPVWMNDAQSFDGKVVHHTGPNKKHRRIRYDSPDGQARDFHQAMLHSPSAARDMAATALQRLHQRGHLE